MIDLKFRDGIARLTEPVGRGLVRVGLTADRLTITGVLIGVVAAWQATEGHLFVATVIATVACLTDLFDGAAAKAAGTPSRRGNYLDSIADRVSESIMYAAVVVYCLNFRSVLLAYVAVLAYMAAQIISYTRAKADALGVDGKVGVMERAERQLTLGVAGIIPGAFAPALIFLAVASTITAIQRMVVVWLRLSRADGLRPPARPRPPHRSRPRLAGRRRLVRR